MHQPVCSKKKFIFQCFDSNVKQSLEEKKYCTLQLDTSRSNVLGTTYSETYMRMSNSFREEPSFTLGNQGNVYFPWRTKFTNNNYT